MGLDIWYRSKRPRLIRVTGFVVALVSYWAPWVAHKSAGLSLAEQDLTEIPKFMPQVRLHELPVVRECFYLPVVVLALMLVMVAASPQRVVSPKFGAAADKVMRWLARGLAAALALVVLPPYPVFLEGFQHREFQVQLVLSVGTLALIVLTPLLRSVPALWTNRILFASFLLAATLPVLQFFWMKPALDAIYGVPVSVGWGVWSGLIGFGLLAISVAVRNGNSSRRLRGDKTT